jgi:hypothetical protein
MDPTRLFGGQSFVIATMHSKERAIAPVVQQAWGVGEIIVPTGLDTDRFGTFTREIARTGTQQEAALAKARAAIALTGCPIALANEGSFGPHPTVPWLPGNLEVVVLVDSRHDLILWGQAWSTDTNFAHRTVDSWEAARAFATEIGFPAHGLVVRVGETIVAKGLVDEPSLHQAYEQAMTRSATAGVTLETDMRAMVNPRRMAVIAQAAQDLVTRGARECPGCHWPGFVETGTRGHAPCEACSFPTPLPIERVLHCHR